MFTGRLAMSEEKLKMEEKLHQQMQNESRVEIYDVEVGQEGMQELNPLVPRASSISLKLSRQSNSRNTSELAVKGKLKRSKADKDDKRKK